MLKWCCPCFEFFEYHQDGRTPLVVAEEEEAKIDSYSATKNMDDEVQKTQKKKIKCNRVFVILKHVDYGYMVLKSFKRRKGLHGQLPGGKVDECDERLKVAAARELFEETGIDVREDLDRLKRATFPNGEKHIKKRAYFRMIIDESDCNGSDKPDTGEDFSLHLSSEHDGYMFEENPLKVAELVALHSGGASHTAIINLET